MDRRTDTQADWEVYAAVGASQASLGSAEPAFRGAAWEAQAEESLVCVCVGGGSSPSPGNLSSLRKALQRTAGA